MKRSYVAILIGLLSIAVTGLITAQEKAASTTAPVAKSPQQLAQEATISKVSQAFAQAFEKGDANAIAAFWTEEGEYIDEGRDVVHGRAALAKSYAGFFKDRTAVRAQSKTDSIRFLGRDTAIEEGTFTVQAKNEPANSSRFSALYVRQDGRWLMALLKEWGDETTITANIENLAWLIGTWETDGPEVKATTIYEWAPNRKFIKLRYEITPKKSGEKGSSGTQIIGVDPASGIIRGWLFDSEGGIGESSWTWNDDHWVIDSSGTLADGTETTSQNFLKRDGDNAFTWRSVKRTSNSESLPDLNIVTVKRIAGGK